MPKKIQLNNASVEEITNRIKEIVDIDISIFTKNKSGNKLKKIKNYDKNYDIKGIDERVRLI